MSRYIKTLVRFAYVGGAVAIGSAYKYTQEKMDDYKGRFEMVSKYKENIKEYFNKFKISNPTIEQNKLSKELIDKVVQQISAYAKEVTDLNNLTHDIDMLNEDELRKRLEEVLKEIIEIQKKHKAKVTNLEKENDELKKEITILVDAKNIKRPAKRKSLVELYGDILDVLSDFDEGSHIKDSLPRVVVVGDQSSGKTSVLEFIAKARIFPRGAGEMMTRAPVMVTMSEGSKHIASFRNNPKVYDLESPTDLAALRNEIENKMLESVKSGKTITNEIISLTMSGPGIPRMVLVDLPGIINTVTSDMSADSKDSIIALAKSYMSNPNSIILCVQDGSLDAERSLVTDLVSSIDPTGSRTICVLTKLDIAERNNVNIDRIKKLLSGKLFHMKALNYYAVIAGTGNPNSSIDDISTYEENFFKNSSLFMDGTIKPSQATSQNLIAAVSQCFWDMVKSSVEREADAFRSRLFALEAEWRHNFPNMRELDRDELFEKAKADILDDVIVFCNIHSKDWEKSLSQTLWKSIMPFIFRDIYLKNALMSSKIGFQTQVEILLQNFLDNKVSQQTLELTKRVMMEKLQECFERNHPQYTGNTYKELFKPLRYSILQECQEFQWSDTNTKNLKIIQKTALSDGAVNERSDWEQACSLMENVILDDKFDVETNLSNMVGPSLAKQWLTWSSSTREQSINETVKRELSKILNHREDPIPKLSYKETSTVLQNLHNEGITIKLEVLNTIWDHLFLIDFYDQSISGIRDCRKMFRSNDFSKHKLGCNDVVLFFKIHKLLQQSVTALRQQICSQEARRYENFIKNTLDVYFMEEDKKKNLFHGKQVELAVEIKKISQVRQQLDKFIEALLREKDL